MSTVYIIAISIITTLTVWLLKRWRYRKTFPGPVGKPIIGVLCDLDVTTLHLKLYEWGKQHGDIFEFTAMGQRYIVLNSTDVAREVLLKEPNATITAARPSTFFGKYLLENYSDVVYASPNSKWTKRRKLVYQLLHAYGEGLVNIQYQIKRNLIFLTKEIRTLNGQCVDPRDTVEEFILNTIENLMVGKITGKDSEMHRILQQFDHLSNDLANVGMDVLYSLLPFLRFLPLHNSRKIKEWFKLKQQIIGTFEKQVENDAENNGIFYSLKKVSQERDGQGQQWFTEDNIGCLLVNLITGGMYLQEKCISAIHFPVHLLKIIVNFWAMHHNQTEWQEPFSFRPERFLDEDGNLLPSTDPVRKRILAFGLGKRNCIGEVFAKTRIFLFVATVLQSFTIKEPDDSELPDLFPREMESGISLQPKPYRVRFESRIK